MPSAEPFPVHDPGVTHVVIDLSPQAGHQEAHWVSSHEACFSQ